MSFFARAHGMLNGLLIPPPPPGYQLYYDPDSSQVTVNVNGRVSYIPNLGITQTGDAITAAGGDPDSDSPVLLSDVTLAPSLRRMLDFNLGSTANGLASGSLPVRNGDLTVGLLMSTDAYTGAGNQTALATSDNGVDATAAYYEGTLVEGAQVYAGGPFTGIPNVPANDLGAFVITMDAGAAAGLKYYLEGALQSEVSAAGAVGLLERVLLGQDGFGTNGLNGKIGLVIIYDRLLDTSEVQQLTNTLVAWRDGSAYTTLNAYQLSSSTVWNSINGYTIATPGVLASGMSTNIQWTGKNKVLYNLNTYLHKSTTYGRSWARVTGSSFGPGGYGTTAVGFDMEENSFCLAGSKAGPAVDVLKSNDDARSWSVVQSIPRLTSWSTFYPAQTIVAMNKDVGFAYSNFFMPVNEASATRGICRILVGPIGGMVDAILPSHLTDQVNAIAQIGNYRYLNGYSRKSGVGLVFGKETIGGLGGTEYTFIIKTTDAGLTWQDAGSNITSVLAAAGLAVNFFSGGTMTDGNGTWVWSCGGGDVILVSHDDGETWAQASVTRAPATASPASVPPAYLPDIDTWVVGASPTGPVYYSTDGGDSWTNAGTDSGFRMFSFDAMPKGW